jgi:hypothetical protein
VFVVGAVVSPSSASASSSSSAAVVGTGRWDDGREGEGGGGGGDVLVLDMVMRVGRSVHVLGGDAGRPCLLLVVLLALVLVLVRRPW